MSNLLKVVVEDEEHQLSSGDTLVVSFKYDKKKWQLRMACTGKELLPGTLYRSWGKAWRKADDALMLQAVRELVENPTAFNEASMEEYLNQRLKGDHAQPKNG